MAKAAKSFNKFAMLAFVCCAFAAVKAMKGIDILAIVFFVSEELAESTNSDILFRVRSNVTGLVLSVLYIVTNDCTTELK